MKNTAGRLDMESETLLLLVGFIFPSSRLKVGGTKIILSFGVFPVNSESFLGFVLVCLLG